MTKRVRSLSIDALEKPTARLKLPARVKPYWHKIATGIALGYRAGPGSWNVRAADGKGGNWIKIIGHADDREKANGSTVLTYDQAIDKARVLARGGDADDPHAGKRPVTVDEALVDYRRHLLKRQANVRNASHPRHHLTPGLLKKPVTMLTARELSAWQSDLLEKGIKASTINRVCNPLRAALNHAVELDPRITNVSAWTVGLSRIAESEPDDVDGDNILEREQRGAIITEAYAINEHLGVYVELHDATGMRSSQIRIIKVRDLKAGREPTLLVPSSLKGKNRTVRRMIPVPISAALAARLQRYAAKRKPNEPMLLHLNGRPWRKPTRRIFEAAGLDPDVITLYALRHTAIVRTLKRGLPIRTVAAMFDTSVAMIEKTYSKWIVHNSQTEIRAALIEDDAVGGNVIALRR